MSSHVDRRQLLISAGCGSLAVAGEIPFLSGLPPVDAQEARAVPDLVRLRPEMEPLVRLIETSSREKLLEAVAAEIRGGAGYNRVMGALLLAGVRNIQPRPVGFQFHAVLVVHSAHLAAQSATGQDRWLPLFWALDNFKASAARDVAQGDWWMKELSDTALPPPGSGRKRFIEAMDRWDEPAADAAIARLYRDEKPEEMYELFWRYGARDFRDIGHKAIYVSNTWRAMKVIGWEHGDPVLRSLAYALLARGQANPAEADEVADRPWRRNLERVRAVRAGWREGRQDAGATGELMEVLRQGSYEDAPAKVVDLLNRGISPASAWDAVLVGASELLMRQPGIVGLHAVTTANALHYGFSATRTDETRLLLLLQAAAFMPMFREAMRGRGAVSDARLDRLAPADPGAGADAVASILADAGVDRASAAGKALAYLKAGGNAQDLLAAARRLVFLKGTDSHDYKFGSAVLEDFSALGSTHRNLYLAGSMFWLKGTSARESPLVARTRAAVGAG